MTFNGHRYALTSHLSCTDPTCRLGGAGWEGQHRWGGGWCVKVVGAGGVGAASDDTGTAARARRLRSTQAASVGLRGRAHTNVCGSASLSRCCALVRGQALHQPHGSNGGRSHAWRPMPLIKPHKTPPNAQHPNTPASVIPVTPRTVHPPNPLTSGRLDASARQRSDTLSNQMERTVQGSSPLLSSGPAGHPATVRLTR